MDWAFSLLLCGFLCLGRPSVDLGLNHLGKVHELGLLWRMFWGCRATV